MASLTNARPLTGARWSLAALLSGLHRTFWRAEEQAEEHAPKVRRHYPPRRERVIESAAMAREMHRL